MRLVARAISSSTSKGLLEVVIGAEVLPCPVRPVRGEHQHGGLVTRFGAALPTGVTWSEIFGIGLLGGIGLTVSLLITDLAFVGEPLVAAAKVGILLASLIAGLAGFFWLRLARPLQLESDSMN